MIKSLTVQWNGEHKQREEGEKIKNVKVFIIVLCTQSSVKQQL